MDYGTCLGIDPFFPNKYKVKIKMTQEQQSNLLRFLASLFLFPKEDPWEKGIVDTLLSVAKDSGIDFSEDSGDVDSRSLDAIQAEYTRLFINSAQTKTVPPFASVYLDPSGLLCQRGLDEAMSFYNEAGLSPVSGTEPEDHVTYELNFLAELLDASKTDIACRFITQHLSRWYPAFQSRLLDAKPLFIYEIASRLSWLLVQNIREEVCNEEKRIP